MPADRTLYVVVHGVGDPDPGETTRDLARGLTAARPAGVVVGVTEERLWVPEPDPNRRSPRLTRAFLVPVFRNDANGRVLAEVNWADLSRFPVSLFGLLDGLFSLLFGLRHIAAAAASENSYAGACVLRGLGKWVAFWLIGPLAASNLLMLALLAAAAITDRHTPESFAGPAGDVTARVACGVAAVTGFVMWFLLGSKPKWLEVVVTALTPRRFPEWWRGLPRKQVAQWIGGSLAFMAVAVLAAGWLAQSRSWSGTIWAVPGVADLRGKIDGIAAGADTPGSDLKGGVVLYAAVAMLPMIAAFMFANAGALVAFFAYAFGFLWRGPLSDRRSALAATVLPFAMLFGWCIIVPFVWLVASVPVKEQLGLSRAFVEVYQALLDFLLADLPLWFVVLGIIVGASLVAALVWWLRKSADDSGKRLIVAWWILFALTAACFALPVLVFAQLTPYERDLEIPLSRPWKVFLSIVLGALPFLPFALKALFPPLRTALDLVLDVVSHFQPCYPAAAAAAGVPEFPIRAAIRARLASVLAYFAQQAGASRETWDVVIVSHSQGTMAVLSCLNDAGTGPALAAFQSLRLVTMGSPFSHIYQHYFRHHYPSLADPKRWGPLQTLFTSHAANRWLNVYRVDDYVGRRIEDDGAGLVENVRVEAYGHTNYWSDGVVMGVLVDKKIF